MNFAIQSTFKDTQSLSWQLAGTTLVFTLLFHNSNVGLNLSIFTLALLIYWLVSHPQQFKHWFIALPAAATLSTTLAVAWYGSEELIFWNFLCLFILSRQIYFPGTSLLLVETKSFLNLFLAPVQGVKFLFAQEAEPERPLAAKLLKLFLFIVLPVCFTWLFAAIYSQLNPYFEKAYLTFTGNLEFSIIFTVILGLLMAFILLKPVTPQVISDLDRSLANDFPQTPSALSENQKLEKQVGTILFALLNFTLLALLVSDIFFLREIASGRADHYWKYVHQGVGMLIFSIIIASGFILYFFREAHAALLSPRHWLKALALIWVLLNIGVVVTTAFKNGFYISGYSLTLKRIGVFIYLALAIAGLLITLFKLHRQKTNAYMLRQLYWSFFVVLSVCICIDWSSIITRYNLNKHVAHNHTLDLDYLLRLDDRTVPIIYAYRDKINSAAVQPVETSATLIEKVGDLKNYDAPWRELTLAKAHARNEVQAMK